MKLFRQLFTFILRLVVFAVIIKYFSIPGKMLDYGEGKVQSYVNMLEDRIWDDDSIDDTLVLETDISSKDDLSIVAGGKNKEDQVVSQQEQKVIELVESQAKKGEKNGVYMYLNTDIDLGDDLVYEELIYILSRVGSQEMDVHVRPLGTISNEAGSLIRGGYMCSNGLTSYRTTLVSLLQKSRSLDTIRRDILIRGEKNAIKDFSSCIYKDTQRTLLLSRAVSKNIRMYPDDTLVDLLRVVESIRK